jgi:oxygen-dependent protoporphyrinogen oxidase
MSTAPRRPSSVPEPAAEQPGTGGRPSRVVVVGGGISGLAAAQRVAELRPDAEVLVLEGADHVGGKLRRVEVAGVLVDVGAEAMLARRSEGLAAARAAGLGAELIHPRATGALLRNRGHNRGLPARTLMGIPTDLDALSAADVVSAATLARIAAEPGNGPYPPLTADLAVAELVGERFGDEVVDRLVDPLLGGVYAGQATEISLEAALPNLAAVLMTSGGSLLEAATALVPPPASPSVSPGEQPPPAPVFASVRGGMGRLAEAMGGGAIEVRLSTTVRGIRRDGQGFVLTIGPVPDASELAADAVIVAVPASKAATLLRDLVPAAASELSSVRAASMAIVTLAFAVDEDGRIGDRRLPAGSGILVPGVEGFEVKAMTFSSQKWAELGDGAPIALLRASLGRAGEEATLQRTDEELTGTVRTELAAITGLDAAPLDRHVQRWGGALPQYEVGHLARVRRIRSAVAAVEGLAVCGATFDGVGIPACIASAHTAADRVVSSLRRTGQ